MVALKALSEYGRLTSGHNSEQELSLSLATDSNFEHDFETITSINALVLQSVEVHTLHYMAFIRT